MKGWPRGHCHASARCTEGTAAHGCAGENCVIKGAVIDDNVSIGSNVRITNEAGVTDADHTDEGYVIQDGIVCILRNAVIPDGFVI